MYDKIVVGTDGSVTASKAVEHAASLAAATGAQLHVAMVTPSIPMVVAPDMLIASAEWNDATKQATHTALEAAAIAAAVLLLLLLQPGIPPCFCRAREVYIPLPLLLLMLNISLNKWIEQ